jgi:cellobiose epimerase
MSVSDDKNRGGSKKGKKEQNKQKVSFFVLFALFCPFCLPSHFPAISASDFSQTPAQSYIPRLERNLKENILPFWLNKSIDRINGGYTINFGPRGEANGPGVKMIVSQARTVWLFARAARAGYCGKECLDAAEHGYRFLRGKMWDERNGGFYWEVDATGNKKQRTGKHLYGQSFALYAVSEYALATRRKDLLDFAVKFFNLLEAKAHDAKFGGYHEFFDAGWGEAKDESPYLGGNPGLKLMNTHLHLLEALTTFYRASKLPLARERLIELINIQSNAVVRKSLGACTDKYERDWTPRLEGEFARVSYGHDLENIWLLIDACDAAGISNYPLLDLYRTLFDYSMKFGYDTREGGFFDSGWFNQPADRLTKVWWVEAEAIVSALYMFRLTREPKYLAVFEKTYQFIEKYQTDWENGEWHANINPNGQPQGDKAQPWKAGYHNGRAMIESMQILKELK